MSPKPQKPTATRAAALKYPGRTTVGIERDVYEKLQLAARAERRSAASLLTHILAAHFAREGA